MARFDLFGRNAIVTGAASGIGRAIALGLAEAGANVAAVDINRAGAEDTAEDVSRLGRRALALETDVTEEEAVDEMVSQVLRSFARIDISCNIPGISIRKPAIELTLAEYRQVLEVDLVGMFVAARAVGRVMVEQRGGSMINMSSIMSQVTMAKNSGYSSAKGGVNQLTKVLAIEWAPYNVRVNAICPGYIKTPPVLRMMQDQAWVNQIESRTPMGRLGEPEEIAGPAIFLASDAASYVTGTTLFADGGWLTW